MNGLLYNFPRNQQLLQRYHQMVADSSFHWQPQGTKQPRKRMVAGKGTYTKDGFEYYYPVSISDNSLTTGQSHLSRRGGKSTQHPYGSLQMYDMNAQGMDGGVSFKDVKKVGKKVVKTLKPIAKETATLAFDQIPRATSAIGATLGSVGAELLGPQAVPVGAILGKKAGEELGKYARQAIKQKTGLGKKRKYTRKSKYIEEYKGGIGDFTIERLKPPKRPQKRPAKALTKAPAKGGKRAPSQWVKDVKAYQASHAGMSYKQAMMELSKQRKGK